MIKLAVIFRFFSGTMLAISKPIVGHWEVETPSQTGSLSVEIRYF
jgi:hypothetical protein